MEMCALAFLHPWAVAIGVAAVGLPILVHWLTRPRPRRLPLSTMRFVREAIHQRRAIHRLRDWIILALRAAAVAMLAWAFSRPLLGEHRSLDSGEAGETSRVIVLDVSQSMAAVQRGVNVFEKARAIAAEHLAGGAGLQADLVFAGAQPRPVFESLSANLADLRRELAAAKPRPEACDAKKALTLGAELLGRASGGPKHRRELIILTDLQETNWRAADFSVLPEDTVIRVESVCGEQVPGNLAVLRAGAAGRSELGQPVRLEIEVGNYSDTPRNVVVDVTVGSGSYQLEGHCQAGGTLVLTGEATLRDGGWQSGEARLVGVEDAVAEDNSRPFVLEVRKRPTFGLVTREEADRRPSSSYFLERALSPEASRDGSGGSVIRIPPSQVNREMLAATDLLVVDRPGKLTADAVALLSALMVRGKPVLYVASEATDATNLKLIAQNCGADLRMPVEFAPPTSRQSRRNLTLAGYQRDLPPFRVFGPQIVAALEPLRFVRGLDSRPVEGGLKDDVLASYNDGTAGLVWAACGTGSLIVLNADLAESNLTRSSVFVPLMGELTGNLLARNRAEQVRHCGESITTWLPPEAGAAGGLEIRSPWPEFRELGELVEEPSGVAWRWPSAGPPGVYEVVRDGKPLLAVATAVPAEESDLRPMSASQQWAGGRSVEIRSALGGLKSQDDLWTWIAVACVSLMLVELIVLRLFRT